tara:strand:+ start:646 stop:1365 length:720 start_codon:yes stop_codon:yes gene_type:complete
MINSVAFFDLAHTGLMNWALAIGFELGAAASLAAIIILDKTNKTMVWSLFILLTAFQMMANSYHAFVNLENFQGWIELFGLQDEELIFQKRVLSIVSGAVLPLVALGFIKSLTDYLKPNKETSNVDEYFEARNKHMVDVVEKGAKARRKENFEKVDKERRSENIKHADETEYLLSSESNKQRLEESIKQADEIESKSEVEESKAESVKATTPQSDDLEIHVDEETGTTYVKSKNKSNPL